MQVFPVGRWKGRLTGILILTHYTSDTWLIHWTRLLWRCRRPDSWQEKQRTSQRDLCSLSRSTVTGRKSATSSSFTTEGLLVDWCSNSDYLITCTCVRRAVTYIRSVPAAQYVMILKRAWRPKHHLIKKILHVEPECATLFSLPPPSSSLSQGPLSSFVFLGKSHMPGDAKLDNYHKVSVVYYVRQCWLEIFKLTKTEALQNLWLSNFRQKTFGELRYLWVMRPVQLVSLYLTDHELINQPS